MRYFVYCFQHYFDIEGRATGKEYWYFILWTAIITMVLMAFGLALWGPTFPTTEFDYLQLGALINQCLVATIPVHLFWLICLIPGITVSVRRLHDIGKGGGWTFFGLLPIIGWIVLVVLLSRAGESDTNRFGDDPRIKAAVKAAAKAAAKKAENMSPKPQADN